MHQLDPKVVIGAAVLLGLVGLAGIFIWRGWTRVVLWVLALPPLWLGIAAWGPGRMAEEFGTAFARAFCAVMVWPALGCVLGELLKVLHISNMVRAVVCICRDDQDALQKLTARRAAEQVECRGITTEELSSLWAILRGMEKKAAPAAGFPCLARPEDGGVSLHRFPEELLTLLSKLAPDRMAMVAEKWGSTRPRGLTPAGPRCLVEDLARLSRIAADTGRNVYLWNEPRRAGKPPKAGVK